MTDLSDRPIAVAEDRARPDVYLMAYACEPGRGSEPGVGFAFARAAADLATRHGYRVTLVTRPHRVEKIRAAIGPSAQHLSILPVPLPWLIVRMTGRRLSRIAYLVWQRKAAAVVERRIRRSSNDVVVHHVSFATEALPAFERRLDRVAPKVFGPAGSAAVPGGALGIRLRRALRNRVAWFNLSSADLLIAQNEDVASSWSRFRARIIVEPNIVIEPMAGVRPEVEWVAATAGRLIERKRYHLALDAFAASGVTGRMAVVGDGPERESLVALAKGLGIADRVDFLGDQDRDAVLSVLARSATLLHPSRQEGAPWVVGEAQSVGATPIVFSGSGSDSIVRAAGMGVVVDAAQPNGMADALRGAVQGTRSEISGRWAADRLPDLMDQWYRTAAATRSAATRGR